MSVERQVRQRLSAKPADVLGRLPLMGKVMIVARDAGVTHERIGIVEQVETWGDQLICIGREHDCAIDLGLVASVVADRSTRMKGKVLPKLEFQDGAGETLFGVFGLGDAEQFDEVVSAFTGTTLEAPPAEPSQPATLADNDPGAHPLNAANKAGVDVTIEFRRPGLKQRWRGLVPEPKPAMGFINIILGDFHLHLRGGVVAIWTRGHADADGTVELAALGQDGQPLGLVLRGAGGAFASA